MTTTAAERRLLTLAALLEETHPEPHRVPVLARLAAERLRRTLADHRRERHSVGFALAYTVRDILQDNLTSTAWAQTPFGRLRPDGAAPSPLPPLPPSALLSDDEPAGLADYLRSVIPGDTQLLLRLVLTLGCRPDEVDTLFGWAPKTAAALVTTHLVALGVVPRSGHRGSGACWGPAWLALAPADGGPACAACRSAVAPLRRLGRLLALQPSDASRAAVLGEAQEPAAPVGRSSSGPVRVRPLPPSSPVSSPIPVRIAVAVVALAATLVPFLSAWDGAAADSSRAMRGAASRAVASAPAPASSRAGASSRILSPSRAPRLATPSLSAGPVRRASRNAEPAMGLRVHDSRFFSHLFPQATQTGAPESSVE